MNKKNIIMLVVAIAIFLVALAVFVYAKSKSNGSAPQQANENTTVNTNITDSNIAKGPYFYDIDDQKLNLDDFSDKPQVILLWKSDNSKSYDIINLFQKYYDEYKDKINFLAINVNEANIDLNLKSNVKAVGFKIPIYFDTDLTLTTEFDYQTLPYVAFINSDGSIDKEAQETIDDDSFQANLELMLLENK